MFSAHPLKQLMKRRGLTVPSLSAKSGFSTKVLRNMLRDWKPWDPPYYPCLEIIERLMLALECSFYDILTLPSAEELARWKEGGSLCGAC